MGDKADGEELKKVNSFQWPTGHIAHLTEGQIDSLERFKKLSQERGYYNPGDDQKPPTHDDETLLRYLRARKFVPQEAFKQLKDTEDWRKENQLDKLYETIDIHEYDQSRRLYPQWTGRRDKRGIPFYVYEIGAVDAKAVSVYANSKDDKKQSTNTKVPWKLLKLFALYENLCRFVLPLCSAIPDRQYPETPISQSNNIVDLSGVGFSKLWNLRSHMSDASNLATAHYPETLDRIFVIGAPSFFPTVWQWVQRWFDPITVSKIFILSQNDMTSTLSKYVDIDNIPKKYGGNLDWKFGESPNLDPVIINNLRWKEHIEEKGRRTFPIGPIKLEYDEDGDLLVTAIGSENNRPRKTVIAGLHVESDVARLALSPGRADNENFSRTTSARVSTPTTSQSSPSVPPATSATTDKMASSDADQNVGKDPRASVQDTSRAGTYTVPYKDDVNDVASPPTDGRAGTSSTRYTQQEGTHAEGTLASGTPEVRSGGHANSAVMEPRTVGQAPKEHPRPELEKEEPTMIDQAKDMAGQAVEQAKQLPATVMSAVGMGGQQEEAKEPEPKKEDPAVDGMAGKKVEEFLRDQTKSKPESENPLA